MEFRGHRRLLIACIALVCASLPAQQQERPDADRWEEAVRMFEEGDRASPPPTGGIVFLGSSSFRRWDLDQYFPGMGLINRGFGGSQMADAIRYLDRIVLPLRPRTLFVYEGDNDIASGKEAATVEREFRELVSRLRRAQPGAKVVFVGIKPSLRRWHLIGEIRDANARIRDYCDTDGLLAFVDTDAPLLGSDGRPKEDLFVSDGLHLSDAGYQVWADLVRPHLD